MASSKEFVEFVVSQLAGAGTITCKRMFGEYGLYRNGLFFGVVCGDQLFVKPTKAGKEFPISQSEAPPYEGAKPYILVEDIDNPELLAEFVQATCRALPAPKPKKPKTAPDKKGV